jgi:hypothetical protein
VLSDLSGVIYFPRDMESAIDEAEVQQVSRVCRKEKRDLQNQQNYFVYRKYKSTRLYCDAKFSIFRVASGKSFNVKILISCYIVPFCMDKHKDNFHIKIQKSIEIEVIEYFMILSN